MNNSERDELLVRVDERVGVMHERLGKGDARMSGHGKRIKRLELWRAGIAAVVGTLLVLLTLLVKVM